MGRQATTRLRLTKKLCEAFEPGDSHAYYYDTEVRGLALRVTTNGAKTFVISRKIDGNPKRITVGRFPDLSMENARARASEINVRVAKGLPPIEETHERSTMTLAELWGEYLERHAQPTKKPKSVREDEGLWRRQLYQWRRKKLTTITQIDVAILHGRVAKRSGPYEANRLVALARCMFNLAIKWKYIEGPNPWLGVAKAKEHKRERFIRPDEMPKFLSAVFQEPDDTLRDAILAMVLTGQRKGTVVAMRFEEIDFKTQTWYVPDSKSGAVVIPLVPEVTSILERRAKCADSEWVFPSPRVPGQHLSEIKFAWHRACQRAGMEDIRPHDARRTTGSWMAIQNSSLSIIGRALGHRSVSATAIYARLTVDPVRAAMERATSEMFKTVNGGTESPGG